MTKLKEKKVNFVSICESMNTNTTYGTLIFNLFGTLAEFERDIMRERTIAGLKAARERGRIGGVPRKLQPYIEKYIVRVVREKQVG